MISDTVRVLLEGTYTPEGYFEDPQQWECERYSASIASGKIEVCMKDAERLPSKEEQQFITNDVKMRFQIQQILIGKPFEFSGLGMTRYREGGKRDVWATMESGSLKLEMGRIDVVVKNADGFAIRDTKAERREDQKQFQALFLKHSGNSIVQKIAASFRSAVEDRKDMLVHLYEITEALGKHFNGQDNARNVLGIATKDWKELTRLANDEPLLEGRHRGKKAELRPATEEEIRKAMGIAQNMIRKYLAYLDT